MAANRVAGMKIIPSGYSVKNVDGKTYLQKRRRSRKRYKLSKKRRDSISKAARKMKIPILTLAVNAYPMANIAHSGFNMLKSVGSGASFRSAAIGMMNSAMPYTGVFLSGNAQGYVTGASWDPKRMWASLGNIGLYALKKTGIFKGANKALASARLPVRLS